MPSASLYSSTARINPKKPSCIKSSVSDWYCFEILYTSLSICFQSCSKFAFSSTPEQISLTSSSLVFSVDTQTFAPYNVFKTIRGLFLFPETCNSCYMLKRRYLLPTPAPFQACFLSLLVYICLLSFV